MAIVTLQPDAQPLIDTTLPETIQEPNSSIFTSLLPVSKINSLLKYVEGYPWTIHYYGQLLNKNNTLEHFDPNTPNLTQSYYKVNNLILQVSSPLSSSYDSTTGITSVTGTAIAPYKLTPNTGDVFIAQVDTGEDAIFHITSVSRKTHLKESLYEISYTLYSYTSANPSFISTLDERVNSTYYFNKDTNFFNRDILIKPSVKEATDRLKNFLIEAEDYYFNTFARKQTGTIFIPGVDYALYDPLLLNFLSKIISYNRLATVPFFRHSYNSSHIDQPSLYDVILSRSISQVSNINKTYNFLPTNLLPNRARLGTAYFTNADYILHPTNPNIKTDNSTYIPPAKEQYLITPTSSKNYNTDTSIIIQTTNNENIYNKQLLHKLFFEDYYLVSENFYNYLEDNTHYNDISYIELIIAKHINKEAIAKEDLVVATQTYMNWSLLHQLYLIPILISIIKANL